MNEDDLLDCSHPQRRAAMMTCYGGKRKEGGDSSGGQL